LSIFDIAANLKDNWGKQLLRKTKMDKKSKFFRLNLLEIKYGGDSVGREIRVNIKISGGIDFEINKRIKIGESVLINQEIGQIKTDEGTLEKEVSIIVTEKDWVFDDVGRTDGVLRVDSLKPFPQKFKYSVSVTERRKIFWKSTALFEIVVEVELVKEDRENENIGDLKKYNSYSGEDYNRYDSIIGKAVHYWNEEFSKDTDPPKNPLDPNLVKAITYQESRVGNDPRNNGLINIMQVCNFGDPSLGTLRGELRENWIHDGKQILLKYDARVETVNDSVYWGVRWLFHKAQYIGIDGRRHWRSWRKSVHEYGPNKEVYTKNVWDIYTRGIKREKSKTIKLWALLTFLVFAAPVFVFFNNIKTAYIKEIVLQSYHTERRPADDVLVDFSESQPELFLAILESTKDWSEGLYVGRINLGKIWWLSIKDPPTEQSILSARFIKLEGIQGSVLEVYGETHMGNGNLYLYRVGEKELSLLFNTTAVDNYNENVWRSQGYPEYGGYSTCGKVYENEKLSADYKDLNGDGISDVVLSGKTNVICEKEVEGSERTIEVRAAEIPVHSVYFFKKQNG